MSPDTTEEDRLAVYQAIRRAGSLPPEAGFYLVAWQADAIWLWFAAASAVLFAVFTVLKKGTGLLES